VTKQPNSLVLLADRHHGLRDSVRGLLEMAFDSVIMVANEASLLEGVDRLKPAMVIVDLSLAGGSVSDLLAGVRERAPGSKIVMLTVHDEPTVAETVLSVGADAVVLKRDLPTDLLFAVDALRAGKRYVSPGLSR
jgi:DNA-binding NarL/FixJ family response regulator